MAHVYRAEQAALHRAVALKVLDRWVLDKPSGSERFLREALAAASIKHPNVVDIVDVGVWHDRPYIVMELLSGCDLDTYLGQRGALSDTEVAGLALPIIAGVMAVHDAGVVHRDLKPSNIFLSNGPEGEIIPKVLDFGVSKISDSLQEPTRGATKTREIIGTPTYMPPEALNGVRELGPRADQYALGALLYECAVGRPPFEGETLLELLKAIALGVVPPPRSIRPDISIALEDAISRSMNANPNARFDTLRDLGRALWPLADERTRTIWSPSFGNGRSSVSIQSLEPTTLLRLPPRPAQSLPRWLPWGLALGALGALGMYFAVGRAAPEPSAASTDEPALAEPAVARRSLPTGAPSGSTPEAADAEDNEEQVEPGEDRENASARSEATKPKRVRPSPRSTRASAATTKQVSVRASGQGRSPSQNTETGMGSDAELNQLFAPTESAPPPRPAAPAASTEELEGLFLPEGETNARGANDSPLTD
jgi:serine/threonine-protein kinase